MWLIASIPFWLLGASFLIGAIVADPLRTPYETDADIRRQILTGLLISGMAFIIAAKIAS